MVFPHADLLKGLSAGKLLGGGRQNLANLLRRAWSTHTAHALEQWPHPSASSPPREGGLVHLSSSQTPQLCLKVCWEQDEFNISSVQAKASVLKPAVSLPSFASSSCCKAAVPHPMTRQEAAGWSE
ncbi:hypothetical protein KIL84_008283 [Mauremys mutica]|uniref:Uncharacterized protein n=1 Tax=Mauremys mutica TaxID=74926 RepID=A0A9D4AZD9_9SAUR|nr:hypothetical protein KIL84_008283 [Mauremys mutica]